MDKKEIRKICLERRNSLSKADQIKYSEIISNKLSNLIKDDGLIFSYYPFNNEVDISSFNSSFPVAYPLITGKHTMDAYVPNHDRFIINSYGIAEPDPEDAYKIDKKDIKYIIVPCLGFSSDLYRLGYGGGYYDTYLKDFSGLKIGIAYDIQRIDNGFNEKHDIKLDTIITEKNTYKGILFHIDSFP